MTDKERYLFLELLLTFFLLEVVLFLLGAPVSSYRVYFTILLGGGLSLSRLNRNNRFPLAAAFVNIAVVGVFVWILYSLLNLSLAYKEVVLLFINGVLSLLIILSFNAYYRHSLDYIQALSIPLFLCFPVFVKDYNASHFVLALIYAICWLVIIKIKFFTTFEKFKENRYGPRLEAYVAVIVFLCVAFSSWVLFYYLPLGKIEGGGFFPEEGEAMDIQTESLEREYYALQDKVQGDVSAFILDPDFKEKQQTLLELSTLIKDTSIVAGVKKAESGLISRLRTPGPGPEKGRGEEITLSIKKYLDKKTLFNMFNLRNKIKNSLKKGRFNIMERISVMDRINKMGGAGTSGQIKEYDRQVRQIVNNSSAGAAAKKELLEAEGQFREWKILDSYRRKAEYLNKKSDSLEGPMKKELKDLLSGIDNIAKVSDLKAAEDEIVKLKESAPSEDKDMMEELDEVLGLRSEMLLSEKAEESLEAIEERRLPLEESEDFRQKTEGIKGARDIKDFSDSLAQYKQKLQENRMAPDSGIKELSRIKAHLLFNEGKERAAELLKEGNLPDKGQGIIRGFDRMESDEKAEELERDAGELKNVITKHSQEGLISKVSRDNLIKDLEGLKGLLKSKLEVDKEIPKRGRADYRDKLEQAIEEASLKKEKKEMLRELGRELFRAETLPQVDDIKKAAHETIDKLPPEEIKKEEARKIADAFDSAAQDKRMLLMEKSLSALRQKVEDLKMVDPQEAVKTEILLKKIRDSRSEQELKKQVKVMEDHLDSQDRQEETEKNKKPQETGNLDIVVLPPYLVIPMGSSASLKGMAVYNNSYIREVGPELEWVSSEPYVAWVDERGVVHSVSKGKTMISAVYSGRGSNKATVSVVDRIDDQAGRVVEGETIR